MGNHAKQCQWKTSCTNLDEDKWCGHNSQFHVEPLIVLVNETGSSSAIVSILMINPNDINYYVDIIVRRS
jgi:hypothetical protein